MHKHFTKADYEVAIKHELARLTQATRDAGLMPSGKPTIRRVDQKFLRGKPMTLSGWWVVRQSVEEGIPDENGDIGDASFCGTGETLGAAFEAAHVKLRAMAKLVKGAA